MSESITCPRCGLTSYNERDIAEGYCGNCHEFWRDQIVAQAMDVMEAYPPYTDEHGIYRCAYGQMVAAALSKDDEAAREQPPA